MSYMTEQVDSILRDYPFGRASAAKRGRNPKFPWVPVIDYGLMKAGIHATRTSQVRGRAFRSRAEAVECAQTAINNAAAHLRSKFLDPRYRALREQYGLPRELTATATTSVC